MEKRLSFKDEILHDVSILDSSTWPSTPGIRHGESQVKRLCRRFNLCQEQAVNGMRDLIEHPESELECLKPLIHCMQTIPCSTAECERGFCLMNIVYTDQRSRMLLSSVSNLMMILSQANMYQHGNEAIALPHKQEGRAHLRCLSTSKFGKFCKLAGYYI